MSTSNLKTLKTKNALLEKNSKHELTALVMLKSLKSHGIDYFFCNPGTDFPAIVEAFSMAEQDPEIAKSVPQPIVVPHENAAVAMAHGVYLITGRPQAVMVHVNVGTANTINGAANASRDQIPIFLLAGRTPLTETGMHGSRSRNIHWAQEMFDQAGMLREFTKWDQELKVASETQSTIDRAMELMMNSPRGPAYLSLPREVLSTMVALKAPKPARAVSAAPWPDPSAVAELAQMLLTAKHPIIITATSGRSLAGFNALSALTQKYAIGVVTASGRYLCLPSSHDMNLGFQTKPFLEEADLVIVLDCDVPWIPSLEGPSPGCLVVHIAEDPAFSSYPTRGFPIDLAIRADSAIALKALDKELSSRIKTGDHEDDSIKVRRALIAQHKKTLTDAYKAQAAKAHQTAHITPEYISECISNAVGTRAIIINEYPLRLEHCKREEFGTLFGLSPAGGLGWGLGAAIGVKLGVPDRLVIATLGDGAYMFDNPTPCHWVSAVQKLPILVIIYNNQMYGAVRNSTLGMYKEGISALNGCTLLANLSPSPLFEKVVEASGGYGERVEDPKDLPAALARAIHAVEQEKRQALLNVVCQY